MSACHAAMRLVAPRALRANAAAASKRRVERGYAPRADRDATERARARVPPPTFSPPRGGVSDQRSFRRPNRRFT